MKKTMLTIGLMAVTLMISNVTWAELVENKDYIVLNNQQSEESTQKIEVIEFFSYGCPYCYIVEPELTLWEKTKSDDVIFTRVAIPRKGRWVEYAKLFYALGMISREEQDRIMPLIYHAIHEEKLNLDDAEKLIAWAGSQGIDEALLRQFYFSEEVNQKLLDALELAKNYELQYVPSVYVNQEYQLILNSKNQYQGTADKLNELIELAK